MRKTNLIILFVVIIFALLSTAVKAGDERPHTLLVVTGNDYKEICNILFNLCMPKYYTYRYQDNIYSGTMKVFVQSYTTNNTNNSYYSNGNSYYSNNSNSTIKVYVFNIKYIDIFGRETWVAVDEKVEINSNYYNYSNMNNFSWQSSGSGTLQLDKIIHILNEFYIPPIYNVYISEEDVQKYKGKLYVGATCDLIDASGRVLATSDVIEYKKYGDGRTSLCVWPKPEEVKIRYYKIAGIGFRPAEK